MLCTHGFACHDTLLQSICRCRRYTMREPHSGEARCFPVDAKVGVGNASISHCAGVWDVL
jgi:hypothetical protein